MPLALTVFAFDLRSPLVNSGMARLPQSKETLAAFGLAWTLMIFLCLPLQQVSHLGLVLAKNIKAKRKIQKFVLLICLSFSLASALFVFTPFGAWYLENLHQVNHEIGESARYALMALIPLPLIIGMTSYHSGLLMRVHRTDLISYATFANIGLSLFSVYLFIQLESVNRNPIRLPIYVIYVGSIVEFAVILLGYLRTAQPSLRKIPNSSISYYRAARFFLPLATVMALQGFSRPVINLFVSRGHDSVAVLAAISVSYSLGGIHYGWINSLKSLVPAFPNTKDSQHKIMGFCITCGVSSFILASVLFFTPLRNYILLKLIAVTPEIAELCTVPLVLSAFLPLIALFRTYYHGVAMAKQQTVLLAPSGPTRIVGTILILVALSQTSLHGATIGIAALVGGYILETIVVVWLVFRNT